MATSTSPETDKKGARAGAKNLFEDPAISEAAADDPVVKFLAEYWKPVLASLVAAGLVMIAYNKITETAIQKRASATQEFGALREQYDQLVVKVKEWK
ncbi:hypothetical protein B7L08_037550, partial [Burkholderia cenocepacia]|uniref:hypothetical protein n=1 Tax=Burkholderia cenocepacia TaxID=95486 RepID=UPI0022385ECF